MFYNLNNIQIKVFNAREIKSPGCVSTNELTGETQQLLSNQNAVNVYDA